ncbi:MAG: VanZ family protein [Rubrivivax sp.]|nr:MAG: VanZ family protein [Rubrivivax sp.]
MPTLLLTLTTPERRAVWRALLLLLLGAITWLATTPLPPRSADLGWDKANHLIAFASLAFGGVWAFARQPRQWPMLVLALLFYGVGIEITQSFLPPREADWHDVVADGLGIALGLLTAWPIARLHQ